MDQLKHIAKLYYEAASQEVKDSARNFFDTLDTDGDGTVDIKEFLKFMSDENDECLDTKLFDKLDSDGNGTLDFFEVVTLYYIYESGRPCCDACREFITGEFFTCVVCCRSRDSYDLCLTCYKDGVQSHKHDGRVQFLDNYSMLTELRLSPFNAGSGDQDQESSVQQPSTSTRSTSSRAKSESNVQPSTSTRSTSSRAKKNRVGNALKALDIAITVGANCTIM